MPSSSEAIRRASPSLSQGPAEFLNPEERQANPRLRQRVEKMTTADGETPSGPGGYSSPERRGWEPDPRTAGPAPRGDGGKTLPLANAGEQLGAGPRCAPRPLRLLPGPLSRQQRASRGRWSVCGVHLPTAGVAVAAVPWGRRAPERIAGTALGAALGPTSLDHNFFSLGTLACHPEGD